MKQLATLTILALLITSACSFSPVVDQATFNVTATARAMPVPPVTIEPAIVPPTATAETLVPTVTPVPCLILGNIDSKGVKRYFMPGNPNYSQVKISKPGEQCFVTEADAQAAGFAKAGN